MCISFACKDVCYKVTINTMARPSKHDIPPSEMILAELQKSSKPLSAYQILDKIKRFGVKSPPIVYRALSALQQRGNVHRIDLLNAYVACSCTAAHTHELSVLTVCTSCHAVAELHDHAIIHHLESLRGMGVPLAAKAVFELPITCKACLN
jgi:Fur family zinc uptake transcriptional regulator